MQKATTAYKVHYSNTPLNQLHVILHVFAAQNDTFLLSHAHISQAVPFPFRALLCSGLLVSTNLHLMTDKARNVGGRGCRVNGWSHKVPTVIPPCFTAEPLPLKSAFPIHSFTLQLLLRLHLYGSKSRPI